MADSLAVDQEAERAVLGSIVLLGDPAYVLKLIRRGLTRECFYWTGYAALYAAAVEIAERGGAVDTITLSVAVERQGLNGSTPTRDQIDQLTGYVPAAGNYADYADRVIDLARWRERLEALRRMHRALKAHDAAEWDSAVAEIAPKAKPAKAEPVALRPKLRLIDPNGEVVSDQCANCQAVEDQLSGAQKEIAGWRARYANLAREKDAAARVSEWWPQAVLLFGFWKERTGHTRSKWTYDRFHECEPMLRRYGMTMCERAIAGVAFQPYTKVRRNGTVQKFDAWHTVFKGATAIEEYACRAPRDWQPTLKVPEGKPTLAVADEQSKAG